MKKSIILSFLIIFSFSTNLKAQKLNRTERKIIEKVKSLDNNSEMQINMERAVVDNSQISAGANDIAETSKTLRSFY